MTGEGKDKDALLGGRGVGEGKKRKRDTAFLVVKKI